MSGHTYVSPEVGKPVDVASFGEIRRWEAEKDIGILWEDARDVFKVVVQFPDGEKLPDPSTVRLQYWQSRWPQERVPRTASGAAAAANAGDWFQGEWKDADVEVIVSSSRVNWPFDDVPKGHWAYQAVTRLEDSRLMVGYPYHSFDGRRILTRFEIAQAIIRAVSPVIAKLSGGQATKQDYSAFMLLLNEFRDEMAVLGIDADAAKKQAASAVKPQQHDYQDYSIADFGGSPDDQADNVIVWAFTFRPINVREFPKLKGFDATYRSTLKMRLLFPDVAPRLRSLQAYTDSTWQKGSAFVELGGLNASEYASTVFNGHVITRAPKPPGFTLSYWYAKPAYPRSFDETIITVRSKTNGFSFAAKDIADGKRIFIRDYGVLVKPADDKTTYAEAEEAYQKGPRSVFDRIPTMPEQTLDRAWNSLPKKNILYIPLAVEGGRQHFGIQPNGDVTLSRVWNNRVKGRDNPQVQWKGDYLSVGFGLDRNSSATGASIEGGVLPIANTWFERDGVRYSQDAFATTLAGKLPPGGRIKGDDSQVLMLRFRLSNITHEAKTAELPIATTTQGKNETLYEKDGLIYSKDGDALRIYMNVNGVARLETAEKTVLCLVDLPPMATREVFAAISFETLAKPEDIAQLKKLNYEQQHKMIADHWRSRIAQGCRIVTPEPMINAFYDANISHQLINSENEIGADDRAIGKVGTFIYGPYGNETTMMTAEMDMRGFSDISQKVLQSWIHYQGTAPLPGDYTTDEGVYQGMGPYEEDSSGYNQNQGWVLWGMAEHYRLTGDAAWLDRVAPSLIKGCDWIIRQRARTSAGECVGIRKIEQGLLPPGMIEDVQDWRSWLSNNAYSYWGIQNVAQALAERKHPEADRLLKEAAAYKSAILAAFTEAMTRTPVVELRDGTWVPNVPSEVHRRGRSLEWITETLEGSILLIHTGIIEPDAQLARWILKDFEDNRYISEQYGYPMPFFERDWFSRGGFSPQPNLLCGPTVYLMRDDVERFLRGYFNGFAVGYFYERAMMAEQTVSDFKNYNGDHFKTSDEAMSASWLHHMFVWEEGNDLQLGKAIPRYWLADGKEVRIEHAETHFGRMSMTMKSHAARGSITMTIDPPTRKLPGAVYARFRHPEGKSMNRVTVNGKSWDKFDPAKEWVVLPPLTKKTVVVAYYD